MDSGVYEIGDCQFVVMSIFEGPEDYILSENVKGNNKIALFHGTIDNATTDFGYHLKDPKHTVNLFRGYAGISAFLSYILLFMLFLTIGAGAISIIIVLIYYSLLPIFFVALSVIALIILDILRERRIKYVRKWAEKIGITDKVKIVFEKI